MPFPPSTKPKLPPVGTDPIKYLSQGPADEPEDGQDAETASMDDPCYKIIHGATIQYGAEKVQAALDQCKADEASEETDGGMVGSDKASSIPGPV